MMKRSLLYTHCGSVIVGYVIVCAFFLHRPIDLLFGQMIAVRSGLADSVGARIELVLAIVASLGAVGLLSGIALMAMREPGKESIGLAVSTIAAFVLLMFVLNSGVSQI